MLTYESPLDDDRRAAILAEQCDVSYLTWRSTWEALRVTYAHRPFSEDEVAMHVRVLVRALDDHRRNP